MRDSIKPCPNYTGPAMPPDTKNINEKCNNIYPNYVKINKWLKNVNQWGTKTIFDTSIHKVKKKPCIKKVFTITKFYSSQHVSRKKNNYHVGFKFAAMNNQYPVVPRIRAFFDPSTRTIDEATNEKNVKDEYNIPSEIVPKSASWKHNSIPKPFK